MEPLSAQALLTLLQSEGISASLPHNAVPWTADSVCIDSRKARKGALFVPLPGIHVDGHDFIEKALAAGASGFLADHGRTVPCSEKAIFVEDTKEALFHLAVAYRKTLRLSMVSVTGSVGKTTTKDFIADILETSYTVGKTEGNYNNELGLPLTLLNLDKSHTAAVTELGMSALGEIERLSLAAKPDIGVITHIGTAHMEHLGSRENIAKAKLEIAASMQEGAPLVVNGLEPLLLNRPETKHLRVLPVGPEGSFLWAKDIVQDIAGTHFTVCGAASFSVFLPIPGLHNVQNALLAIAVGLLLAISPEKMVSALQNAVPAAMRQRLYQTGGVTILEDCYNASPDSMEAALDVLKDLPGRRFAILGDMLELGAHTEQTHRALGRKASETADVLVACGESMQFAVEEAKWAGCQALHVTKPEAAEYLAGQVSPGDSVLFKGSRGMRMEEVLDDFLRKAGLTREKREAH
jgi:UDP-N-acetylmuramoyl-tripeptide--D-alanyl-D-alanine ligase